MPKDGFEEVRTLANELAKELRHAGATFEDRGSYIVEPGIWAETVSVSRGAVVVVDARDWDSVLSGPCETGPGTPCLDVHYSEGRDGRAFLESVTRWYVRCPPTPSPTGTLAPLQRIDRYDHLARVPAELSDLSERLRDLLSRKGYRVVAGSPDWRVHGIACKS